VGNSLIDLTLKEIAKGYQLGTLPWMKANRPNKWGKILTLERRINGMILRGNLNGLRGALNEYQSLILAMVKEFIPFDELFMWLDHNGVILPRMKTGEGMREENEK
jgi:hypothetical protein